MHAFLIVAHDDAASFGRLASTLSDTGPVFAHIDAKADEEAFRRAAGHVRFVPVRVPVTWGSWSLSDAVLASLRHVLRDRAVGRVTLLSGNSYPIVSPSALAADWRSDWIAGYPAPCPEAGKPSWRFSTPFVAVGDVASVRSRAVQAVVRRVAHPPRAPWPLGGSILLRGGSTWWSLRRETIERVLSFAVQFPQVVSYFRRLVVPDELFFQTLAPVFSPAWTPEGHTFVRWSCGAHPEALSPADVAGAVRLRRHFFVRKLVDVELAEAADVLRAGNDGPLHQPHTVAAGELGERQAFA